MDPGGAARQRPVQQFVGQDARTGAADERYRVLHERGEIRGLEIPFAHLNEVDAALECPLELGQQTLSGAIERSASPCDTAPIGHQAADHGGGRGSWAGGSRGSPPSTSSAPPEAGIRRAANTTARSAKPA